MQMILSCAISFTWVSLIQWLNLVWFKHETLSNIWSMVIISIILSIIVSTAFSIIYLSQWFRNFLIKHFGITSHDSVWKNVAHCKNGANLKVYLKNKDFYIIGHLYSFEDNSNNSWFCLHEPQKYNLNNQLFYSQEGNSNAYLVFNLNEVEFIEIFTG